jgi:hypothetical protein
MKTKTNSSEHESRVEKALELMLTERIKYDDYLKFAKDEYGISRNAANNIWVGAREIRREYFKEAVEDNIINAIQELYDYEERMLTDDEPGLELKAKELRYKISGLFKERFEVEHKGELNINLSWGSENLNTLDSSDVE